MQPKKRNEKNFHKSCLASVLCSLMMMMIITFESFLGMYIDDVHHQEIWVKISFFLSCLSWMMIFVCLFVCYVIDIFWIYFFILNSICMFTLAISIWYDFHHHHHHHYIMIIIIIINRHHEIVIGGWCMGIEKKNIQLLSKNWMVTKFNLDFTKYPNIWTSFCDLLFYVA